MFEDSTFESAGRIETRSSKWLIATFALNSTLLLALTLIPLFYPEALPRQAPTPLLVAPAAPAELRPLQKLPQRQLQGAQGAARVPMIVVLALPVLIAILHNHTELPPNGSDLRMDQGSVVPAGGSLFVNRSAISVVHPTVKGPARVSSGIMSGLLIEKSVPVYPVIAKAAGVQGTVILQAMISRAGTIRNLRVISGPVMLQQAALDAVARWRYRPYLLNGQPVEVDTTVNVVFTMDR